MHFFIGKFLYSLKNRNLLFPSTKMYILKSQDLDDIQLTSFSLMKTYLTALDSYINSTIFLHCT